MKTQVASTSLSTFRDLQGSGELQAKEIEVMDLMRKPGIGALTREQIAQRLGWKESAVCGRCNSLVKKKYLEEVSGGKTSTGRSAKMLRLPQGPAASH
jgi:predicted ArsR family transcriptional regulator